MKPRFLNGCAKSVSLVEAMESKGWDAWTCDILPSEGWHKHIQDDVLKHLNDGWDMGVFHPDCTFLANSGIRWLYIPDPLKSFERWRLLNEASVFFNKLLNAPIPRICVENPIHHRFARKYVRKYDQIIQPWNFGDMETKAICLWLKGLPRLVKEITIQPEGIKQSVWREPPSPERKANRSRNFPNISRAMADQWGGL